MTHRTTPAQAQGGDPSNVLRRVSGLRSRGYARAYVAAHLGVTDGQMQYFYKKQALSRWDAPGVLMIELCQEVRELTASSFVAHVRTVLGIEPHKYAACVLQVTHQEADTIRAYFAELFRRRDEWPDTEQAARLIGVRPVTLRAALQRGFAWASDIERCTVPSKGRWGYRYEPQSVAEAAQRRKGQ